MDRRWRKKKKRGRGGGGEGVGGEIRDEAKEVQGQKARKKEEGEEEEGVCCFSRPVML